ncbi:hypothetical protein OC835_006994 [Tilletia horrida]|nr:hypothetical protein OC835_006994 [Tilletia horrida]
MLLDPLNRFSICWSLIGALIICVTCLARASEGPSRFQSGRFVFRQLINQTGWPDGVAWMLGLLQSTFGLTATDGVSHMSEEMPRPNVNVPRAMLLAVASGASTSFVVLVILLFVLNDFNQVIKAGSGPLLQIIYQATRSEAASVSLLMFPLLSMAFAAIGQLCAASRQTHTFAMDDGLPFSRFLSREASPRLGRVPWAALTLTTTLVIIFGCIYLGNSTALNAILSSSVVALEISYAIPPALLLVRGRGLLDMDLDEALTTDAEIGAVLAQERKRRSKRRRPFDLGVFGYAINAFALIFCIVTIAFFLLPPTLPATAENMNYTAVVVAIIIIVASLTWILDGRYNFEGPTGLQEILLRLNASGLGGKSSRMLRMAERDECHSIGHSKETGGAVEVNAAALGQAIDEGEECVKYSGQGRGQADEEALNIDHEGGQNRVEAVNNLADYVQLEIAEDLGIPPMLLLMRGCRLLDEALATDAEVGAALAKERKRRSKRRRSFDLGVFGNVMNAFALVSCVVTLAFFLLPPELPTAAENMNCTAMVEAIVIVVASLTWILDGRQHSQRSIGFRTSYSD